MIERTKQLVESKYTISNGYQADAKVSNNFLLFWELIFPNQAFDIRFFVCAPDSELCDFYLFFSC